MIAPGFPDPPNVSDVRFTPAPEHRPNVYRLGWVECVINNVEVSKIELCIDSSGHVGLRFDQASPYFLGDAPGLPLLLSTRHLHVVANIMGALREQGVFS